MNPKNFLKPCILITATYFLAGVQSLLRQTTENPEDSDDNGSSPAPPAKKLKLKEYSTRLEKDFSGGLEWRDATIDKWNDKTQLASASSKSGSGIVKNAFYGYLFTIQSTISLCKHRDIWRSFGFFAPLFY